MNICFNGHSLGAQLLRCLGIVVCFSMASTVFSQNLAVSEPVRDPASVTWKTATDLSAVLVGEVAKLDVNLANPDLPEADRILFTAYRRLLTEIMSNGQANAGEVLNRTYAKILKDAPNDPLIKGLDTNGFASLTEGLIELLQPVPVAEPARF